MLSLPPIDQSVAPPPIDPSVEVKNYNRGDPTTYTCVITDQGEIYEFNLSWSEAERLVSDIRRDPEFQEDIDAGSAINLPTNIPEATTTEDLSQRTKYLNTMFEAIRNYCVDKGCRMVDITPLGTLITRNSSMKTNDGVEITRTTYYSDQRDRTARNRVFGTANPRLIQRLYPDLTDVIYEESEKLVPARFETIYRGIGFSQSMDALLDIHVHGLKPRCKSDTGQTCLELDRNPGEYLGQRERNRYTFPGCCSNNIVDWVSYGSNYTYDSSVTQFISLSSEDTTPMLYCATLDGNPLQHDDGTVAPTSVMIEVDTRGRLRDQGLFEYIPDLDHRDGDGSSPRSPQYRKTVGVDMMDEVDDTMWLYPGQPRSRGRVLEESTLDRFEKDKEVLLGYVPADHIRTYYRVKMIYSREGNIQEHIMKLLVEELGIEEANFGDWRWNFRFGFWLMGDAPCVMGDLDNRCEISGTNPNGHSIRIISTFLGSPARSSKGTYSFAKNVIRSLHGAGADSYPIPDKSKIVFVCMEVLPGDLDGDFDTLMSTNFKQKTKLGEPKLPLSHIQSLEARASAQSPPRFYPQVGMGVRVTTENGDVWDGTVVDMPRDTPRAPPGVWNVLRMEDGIIYQVPWEKIGLAATSRDTVASGSAAEEERDSSV
jgi:hypothetical protein